MPMGCMIVLVVMTFPALHDKAQHDLMHFEHDCAYKKNGFFLDFSSLPWLIILTFDPSRLFFIILILKTKLIL